MLVTHASFLRKQESMYSGGLAICRLLLIAFSLLTSITAHAQVSPQDCRPEQKGDATLVELRPQTFTVVAASMM